MSPRQNRNRTQDSNSSSGSSAPGSVDVIITGGGLTGVLTALTLRVQKPDLKICLIEAGDRVGGNHTWGFAESDVSASAMDILRPILTHSWPEYSVKFPKMERTFKQTYHALRSEDLHREITKRGDIQIMLNSRVNNLSDGFVVLENGKVIEARCVFDARGSEGHAETGVNGFEKFIGIDVRLKSPHGLQAPVTMDAVCPQLDGFRFFSILPWDDKRLMISENYYSDAPALNRQRILLSLRSQLQRQGWEVDTIEREETGVVTLPMAINPSVLSASGEPVTIGTRGGYYHSATGDSLPDTMRIAEFVAALPDLTSTTAREGLAKFRRPILSRQRFYRFVNRLMFYGCEPTLRYTVFERLYMLPQELVERFNAARTTWSDRLRIFNHRPQLPMSRTLRNIREKSLRERLHARFEERLTQGASEKLSESAQ